MIRYFLAKGDRAGSATIIQGLPDCGCSNPRPRVEIATLHMKTYCTACKRDGFIAPKGPRWPGTASNGKQWALSGDINVCGCYPPPVFYAQRGMSMSFTARQVAALTPPRTSSRDLLAEDTNENLERYFEIVDAKTEIPIEGMTHKLSSNGQAVVYDSKLAGGRTRALSVKDHPNLTFVAWIEGDVR